MQGAIGIPLGIKSHDWIKQCVPNDLLVSPRQFLLKLVLVYAIAKFSRPTRHFIADILKESVAGGLRHVRALRCETAVKGQGLSCVIR
jgi:hypothetical protein